MKINVIHPYSFDFANVISVPHSHCEDKEIYLVPQGDYYTISRTSEQLKARIKYLMKIKKLNPIYKTRFRRLLDEKRRNPRA